MGGGSVQNMCAIITTQIEKSICKLVEYKLIYVILDTMHYKCMLSDTV